MITTKKLSNPSARRITKKVIMAGKSYGSQAFIDSITAVSKNTSNQTATMIMYRNMAHAISLYHKTAMIKVFSSIFGSTFLGGII